MAHWEQKEVFEHHQLMLYQNGDRHQENLAEKMVKRQQRLRLWKVAQAVQTEVF